MATPNKILQYMCGLKLIGYISIGRHVFCHRRTKSVHRSVIHLREHLPLQIVRMGYPKDGPPSPCSIAARTSWMTKFRNDMQVGGAVAWTAILRTLSTLDVYWSVHFKITVYTATAADEVQLSEKGRVCLTLLMLLSVVSAVNVLTCSDGREGAVLCLLFAENSAI